MRDLLHTVCAIVSLISDVGIKFALSAFVGVTLVTVTSTDTGTASGTVVIASVAGFFLFLTIFSCRLFTWND